MDWCGSSTPRTPEYRTMNEERHERKAYWLVIVRPQFLNGGDTNGLCPPSLSIQGMEGQSFWFFRVVKELNNENRWRVPDRSRIFCVISFRVGSSLSLVFAIGRTLSVGWLLQRLRRHLLRSYSLSKKKNFEGLFSIKKLKNVVDRHC